MRRLSAACFLLLISVCAHAQMQDYKYRRPLKGINQQWHSIEIPDDIYDKLNIVHDIYYVPTKTNKAFSDIRLYGITENKDTVEAPFFLKTGNEENRVFPAVNLSLLNEVRKGNTYYFTLEAEESTKLNTLDLDFAQENFDWEITLEGSNNGNEWFTILENERILSIKNNFTDYQFTTLHFRPVQYKFLRISIPADKKPLLQAFQPQMSNFTKGNYRLYKADFSQWTDKKAKTTRLDISLDKKLPVSLISVFVSDSFDYYRPIAISYLSDSFQTPKGWEYKYANAFTGVLSSLEKSVLNLGNIYTQKLKIEIQNHDNQPLRIDSVQVQGAKHELIARFTEKAQYFIVYGNPNSQVPDYDISRFDKDIPVAEKALQVGEEEVVHAAKTATNKTRPLFENKLWLWGIMILVIALLGWFTFSMIRSK